MSVFFAILSIGWNETLRSVCTLRCVCMQKSFQRCCILFIQLKRLDESPGDTVLVLLHTTYADILPALTSPSSGSITCSVPCITCIAVSPPSLLPSLILLSLSLSLLFAPFLLFPLLLFLLCFSPSPFPIFLSLSSLFLVFFSLSLLSLPSPSLSLFIYQFTRPVHSHSHSYSYSCSCSALLRSAPLHSPLSILTKRHKRTKR